MASNNENSLQRQRSLSLEIVDARCDSGTGHARSISYPQPQHVPRVTAPTSDEAERQPPREQVMVFANASRGPRDPPSNYVQLNSLTVGRADLTELYGATYPALDYADSFAVASMPHLPAAERKKMERLHLSLRPEDEGSRRTVRYTTAPTGGRAASKFVEREQAARQASAAPDTQAPTAPTPTSSSSPARPGIQTARSTQGAQQAPPATNISDSAPTPANQRPQYNPANAALAAQPGESELDLIHRRQGIDITDATNYYAGTAPIAQNVQDLVNQIKAIKKNGNGYPIRQGLKEMREHFLQMGGKLRWTSFLWQWYGDTRLFTMREWYYLATEGRGEQVPWPSGFEGSVSAG